jgi:hypothetical protein
MKTPSAKPKCKPHHLAIFSKNYLAYGKIFWKLWENIWGCQYLSQQVFFCVILSWDLVWLNLDRKIWKIWKFPLTGLTGQSGVHRTLHCALSGAPVARAQIHFLLCGVRWFTEQLLCAVWCALDMHCRLSGAPITRFKKRTSSPRPSQRSPFPSTLWLFLVSGDFSSTHRRRSPVAVL